MINLILFTVLGLALFGSFIFIALRDAPKSLPDSSAVLAVGQIINLEGSSFANARRFLHDTDYQVLCSRIPICDVWRERLRERP